MVVQIAAAKYATYPKLCVSAESRPLKNDSSEILIKIPKTLDISRPY